jgi:hypothetical protein
MIEPGAVIDSLGKLQKQNQVLRAKIEAPFWAPKIKAFVFTEFAFGVFAAMPQALGMRPDRADALYRS